MHVVEGNTLTNAAGILGIVFLKENKITLSYSKQDVLVKEESWTTLDNSREIIIPTRTQKLLIIPTNSKRDRIIDK